MSINITVHSSCGGHAPAEAERRAGFLIDIIQGARYMYAHGDPVISDAQYDNVVKKLAEVEGAYGLNRKLRTTSKHHHSIARSRT